MKTNFFKKWLSNHKYCVLATSYKDKPWAATVNYSIDDNLNVYVTTNPRSLKFKNLLKNPMVCVVIDSQSRDGTMQIQGNAKPLKPKTREAPNLIIRPKFLIFRKKSRKGGVETKELRLN